LLFEFLFPALSLLHFFPLLGCFVEMIILVGLLSSFFGVESFKFFSFFLTFIPFNWDKNLL